MIFITFNNRLSNDKVDNFEGFSINQCKNSTYKKRTIGECRLCPEMPDMSKYVLKSSIPPCPKCPNLDNYVLKTNIQEGEDMSKYVLKSSIPPCNPTPCPPCKCPEPQCPSLHEIKELIKNENKHKHHGKIKERERHHKHHRKKDDFCKNDGFNMSFSKYGLLNDLRPKQSGDDDNSWNNWMAAPAPAPDNY